MTVHGRIGMIGRLALSLAAALGLLLPADAAPPEPLPAQSARPIFDPMCSEAMRADARLNDVCFVDRQRGWAVGDRGTIWHTDDGGQHWHLQRSGVSCRLESVFFLDEKVGWAAGGYAHPYTHTGTGVVLSTGDGGRRWSHNPRLLVPALKKIRFFDEGEGWALGCSSAMFPTGVMASEDGGRSWNPLPGGKTAGWAAGDLLARHHGVLADQTGMAAILRRGAIEPAATPRFGLRHLARLRLVREVEPQLFGWLVGEGGLVMWTSDLGTTWQTPRGRPPEGLPQQLDFAALAVLGPKVWIAGSPGTRLLHTADAGQSWIAFPTGNHLPLRGLCFVDDRHGWAVGELGTILATTDGGQSWQRQHCGGTRAALLGLFAEPKDVPLELFAQLSANEGYLGAVETLARRDLEITPQGDVPAADRLHEAVVAVGASSGRAAWRFPLRQEGLNLDAKKIAEGWDRANDGRGLAELEAHVVGQIRLWRPEVVVTHDASPTGDDPCGDLVHQVVLEAVRQAADPTAYAEQITRAGLEPWQVKKVYALLKPGVHGAANLSTAELADRLGCSLAEIAAMPRGLLEDRFEAPPMQFGFRLLADNLPRQPDRQDFFTGIVLYPGGEARRELLEPSAETAGLIRRIAQKRRNLQTILERTEENPQSGLGLLAQAGTMIQDVDPDGSAQILCQLAQRYCQSGRWPMAADAFALLARRHPDHPLARAALVWLVQYYASAEAAWRVHGHERVLVQQASAPPASAGRTGPRGGVQPILFEQASAPAIDFSKEEDRPERAAALGKQIQQSRPALFAEPRIRFPLAAADRRRGFPREAERFYLAQSRGATHDAWWACAQGEQWLADPKGLAPKPVLSCARAPSKPRLDARLEDEVWRRAKRAELRSPQGDDADWPATVMLAYDDGFLYAAIEARQAPGAEYPEGEGPRPRDPDLSARDRIELLLDLDRDFATYYRLVIDHRGRPREECWGDVTWNPTWFVAAASEDGTWTAEAAIPLDQLTGQYPSSRSAWAIGIQRTVPGVGFQSWNSPAAATIIPEGFGYLIFD